LGIGPNPQSPIPNPQNNQLYKILKWLIKLFQNIFHNTITSFKFNTCSSSIKPIKIIKFIKCHLPNP
jgi:hypothetical protein